MRGVRRRCTRYPYSEWELLHPAHEVHPDTDRWPRECSDPFPRACGQHLRIPEDRVRKPSSRYRFSRLLLHISFQSRLFQNTRKRARRDVRPKVAWDHHDARLLGVRVNSVVSPGAFEPPAVLLDQIDRVANLHLT